MAPQQHAVQCAGVGDQALPAVGLDQAFDQGVDGGVLETDQVAAAGVVGAAGVPVFALLVARRAGLAEAADDQVEVARAQAVDVLRDVGAADLQLDAETGQVALERQQHALELDLREEELDHHRLALGIQHAVLLQAPAGLLQQLEGTPALLADHPAAVALRRLVLLAEHLGRQLCAPGFEQLQLGGRGQAAGGQLGVLEVAAGAHVGAVE
ncbi:hypothetical protein D3C86_1425920 [compost metagenome]